MAKEIENSVLERCSPHGDVVHVYIDRRSPYVSHSTSEILDIQGPSYNHKIIVC